MARAPKLSAEELLVAAKIGELIGVLDSDAQQRVLQHSLKSVTLVADRAGPILRELARIIPRDKSFTAKEIRRQLRDRGIVTIREKFFSALFYLYKNGKIRRIGPARYVVTGR